MAPRELKRLEESPPTSPQSNFSSETEFCASELHTATTDSRPEDDYDPGTPESTQPKKHVSLRSGRGMDVINQYYPPSSMSSSTDPNPQSQSDVATMLPFHRQTVTSSRYDHWRYKQGTRRIDSSAPLLPKDNCCRNIINAVVTFILHPRTERGLRLSLFLIPVIYLANAKVLQLPNKMIIPVVYTACAALMPPKISSFSLIIWMACPAILMSFGVVTLALLSLSWVGNVWLATLIMMLIFLVFVSLLSPMKAGEMGHAFSVPVFAAIYVGDLAILYTFVMVRDGIKMIFSKPFLEDKLRQSAAMMLFQPFEAAKWASVLSKAIGHMEQTATTGQNIYFNSSVPESVIFLGQGFEPFSGIFVQGHVNATHIELLLPGGSWWLKLFWSSGNNIFNIFSSALACAGIGILFYFLSLLFPPPPRFIRSVLRSELTRLTLRLRYMLKLAAYRMSYSENDSSYFGNMMVDAWKLEWDPMGHSPDRLLTAFESTRVAKHVRLKSGPLSPDPGEQSSLDSRKATTKASIELLREISDLRTITKLASWEISIVNPGPFVSYMSRVPGVLDAMRKSAVHIVTLLEFSNARQYDLQLPSASCEQPTIIGSPSLKSFFMPKCPLPHTSSHLISGDDEVTLGAFQSLALVVSRDELNCVMSACLNLHDAIAELIALKPVTGGSELYAFKQSSQRLEKRISDLDWERQNLASRISEYQQKIIKSTGRRQEGHEEWATIIGTTAALREFQRTLTDRPLRLAAHVSGLAHAECQRSLESCCSSMWLFMAPLSAFLGGMLKPITNICIFWDEVWHIHRADHKHLKPIYETFDSSVVPDDLDSMTSARKLLLEKIRADSPRRDRPWWTSRTLWFCCRFTSGVAIACSLSFFWDDFRSWSALGESPWENRSSTVDMESFLPTKSAGWVCIGFLTSLALTFEGTVRRSILRFIGVFAGCLSVLAASSLFPHSLVGITCWLCVTNFVSVWISVHPRSPLLGFHPSIGYSAQLFTFQSVTSLIEVFGHSNQRAEILVSHLASTAFGIGLALFVSCIAPCLVAPEIQLHSSQALFEAAEGLTYSTLASMHLFERSKLPPPLHCLRCQRCGAGLMSEREREASRRRAVRVPVTSSVCQACRFFEQLLLEAKACNIRASKYWREALTIFEDVEVLQEIPWFSSGEDFLDLSRTLQQLTVHVAAFKDIVTQLARDDSKPTRSMFEEGGVSVDWADRLKEARNRVIGVLDKTRRLCGIVERYLEMRAGVGRLNVFSLCCPRRQKIKFLLNKFIEDTCRGITELHDECLMLGQVVVGCLADLHETSQNSERLSAWLTSNHFLIKFGSELESYCELLVVEETKIVRDVEE